MFDFAPVGGLVALAGLAFVALAGWRLIPQRDRAAGGNAMADIAPYIAELTVPEGSDHIGEPLSALTEDADKAGVVILGLVRGSQRRIGVSQRVALAAGDSVVLEAEPDALDEFRAATHLDFADSGRLAAMMGEGERDALHVLEVVVPLNARIAGKSAAAIGLGWRRRTILMGIARQGRRIRSHVRTETIHPGDILLLLARQIRRRTRSPGLAACRWPNAGWR